MSLWVPDEGRDSSQMGFLLDRNPDDHTLSSISAYH